MSTNYVQYTVYFNILKYIEYRNMQLISEKLTEQQLKETLPIYNHIQLTCKEPNGGFRRIILYEKNAHLIIKPVDMKKLIEKIAQEPDINTVMVISYEPLKKLPVVNNIRLIFTHYDRFKEYMPDSNKVGISRLLLEDEYVPLFEKLRIKKEWLGRIQAGPYAEPMIVWNDYCIGQIIELRSIVESTGYDLQYYFLIPNNPV